MLKIRSKHPEVFCENTFLKTFTKFTLFWKTSQNSLESICDEVFFEWNFEPSGLQLLYKGLYRWYFPENLWNFLKQLLCVARGFYMRVSKMFYKNHRKTLLSQFLFNEVAGLQLQAFLKTDFPTNIFQNLFCQSITRRILICG